MAKINCLTQEIAQKIAAGEVVERPASVVKELLENAMDAGATEITVEIQNGGIRYIRLTDNGCGIAREDVPTAFLSHATSKISTEADLNEIMTLGFRGEALPSIAAVSKFQMMTKQKADFTGTRIVLLGGVVDSIEEAGCPDGTTIQVRDLFYNTPARMKFLKSDRAEGMAVSALVDHLALSHPDIAFCFIKDGKVQTRTSGNGDLHATIYALYGKEFSESLLPVQYASNEISVHGYISKPFAARGSNSMQHFFVNSRYFKNKTVSAALMEAYKNAMMVGRYPAAVLFMDINPQQIDVNVHPAKTEVRFSNERALFNAVYTAAKTAILDDRSRKEAVLTSAPIKKEQNLLQKTVPTGEQLTWEREEASAKEPEKAPSLYVPKGKPKATEIAAYRTVIEHTFHDEAASYVVEPTPSPVSAELPNAAPTQQKSSIEAAAEAALSDSLEDLLLHNQAEKPNTAPPPQKPDFAQPQAMPEQKQEPQTAPKEHQIRVLGEAYQTYIFAECDGELYSIDKHAAHERLLFDKLKKENGQNGAQMLLSAIPITLSKEEYAALTEHSALLESAGFLLEDFGEGTILLRACPLNLEKEDATALLTEIAGYLLSNHRDTTPQQLDWVYHSMACRAAIKAGSDLTQYEMEHLVKTLFEHEEVKCCPHGRPVMVHISKHNLDKQFGRLG